MFPLKTAIAKIQQTSQSLKVASLCTLSASIIAPATFYLQAEIDESLKTIERSHILSINLERTLSSFLSMELAARSITSYELLDGAGKEEFVDSLQNNSQQLELYIAELKGQLAESTLAEMNQLKAAKEASLNKFISSFATDQKGSILLIRAGRFISDDFRSLVRKNQYQIVAEQETLLRKVGLLLVGRFVAIASLSASVVGVIGSIGWRNHTLSIQRQSDACQLDIREHVRQEKAKAISQLAHDVKLYLQPILTSSELMQRYGNSNPQKFANWLNNIFRSVRRINELASDLTLVSSLELNQFQPELESASLVELINSIVEDFTNLIKRQINPPRQLVTYIKGEPRDLLIDVRLCDRAIRNLLNNAIKYSPSGGLIYVSVDLEAMSISVADEGIGIPDGIRDKLFNAFQRADNVGMTEGFGLGLSVAKATAIAHGGSVSVRSPGSLDGYEFKTVFELRLSA
jgi:signal transduction histidine kinase